MITLISPILGEGETLYTKHHSQIELKGVSKPGTASHTTGLVTGAVSG